MQDIVTESIQLQTTKNGIIWLAHYTVLACPVLANTMHDIVPVSIQLQINNDSVWLPIDTF